MYSAVLTAENVYTECRVLFSLVQTILLRAEFIKLKRLITGIRQFFIRAMLSELRHLCHFPRTLSVVLWMSKIFWSQKKDVAFSSVRRVNLGILLITGTVFFLTWFPFMKILATKSPLFYFYFYENNNILMPVI